MIDIKILKQLIQLMKANDLTELDLRDKEEQVTLKRANGGVIQPVSALPHLSAPVSAVPAAMAAAPQAPVAADSDAGLTKITSPMVGTYYAAPSPDAETFVKVGSQVGPDTVVCILEAMKVFNEIKAECSGTVVKALVTSGQAVEFGQPLFLVKPN